MTETDKPKAPGLLDGRFSPTRPLAASGNLFAFFLDVVKSLPKRPFQVREFYFRRDELAGYFPHDVIKWMEENPGERSPENRQRDEIQRSRIHGGPFADRLGDALLVFPGTDLTLGALLLCPHQPAHHPQVPLAQP